LEAFRALTAKLDKLAAVGGQSPPAKPQGTAAPAQQEITVVNKIPATFLYVMKEQFNLMKGWLEPLTRITADQDDQLKELHAKIGTVLEKYDTMIDKLEHARPSDGEDAEVFDD